MKSVSCFPIVHSENIYCDVIYHAGDYWCDVLQYGRTIAKYGPSKEKASLIKEVIESYNFK
jgi:hypothetical protein